MNANITYERILEAQRSIADLMYSELEDRIQNLDLDNKIDLTSFYKNNYRDFTEDMVHIFKTEYLIGALRRVSEAFRMKYINVTFEMPEDFHCRKAAVRYLVRPIPYGAIRSFFKKATFASIAGVLVYNMIMYYQQSMSRNDD